jgi:hypothetical protein
MEPVTYSNALQHFHQIPTPISTLGLRSEIRVCNVDGVFYLINSRNKRYNINENIWDRVMERINELPNEDRYISKSYTLGTGDGYWPDCPNKVLAVYIPAILRYINLQGAINNQ